MPDLFEHRLAIISNIHQLFFKNKITWYKNLSISDQNWQKIDLWKCHLSDDPVFNTYFAPEDDTDDLDFETYIPPEDVTVSLIGSFGRAMIHIRYEPQDNARYEIDIAIQSEVSLIDNNLVHNPNLENWQTSFDKMISDYHFIESINVEDVHKMANQFGITTDIINFTQRACMTISSQVDGTYLQISQFRELITEK